MKHPLFPYSRRRRVDPVAEADALVVEELTVAYPGGSRPALRQFNLRAAKGTRLALVGANGAGKSTLLKAVAGLLTPSSGRVRIYGNPVGACHHRVAYLPQRAEIDWRFPVSVRRLVLTGRYVHLGWLRWPGAEDRRIVAEALERLRLGALADRQISQLSGGQQQRALLARALAQEADLLLLDEPLNAVDAETCAIVQAVLTDLRQQGKTVIAATHDLGRVESDFDSAVCLCEGCRAPLQPPPNGPAAKRREAWTG
jgi:manganese/zinc/iron transport system ATP- binding protein